MRKLTLILTKKSLLTSGLVLLALGITSIARALPAGSDSGGTGYEYVYYSDSTFNDVVGDWYMECNGSPSHFGIRTSYLETSVWDCAGGGSIGFDCPSGFWICDYEAP